MKIEAKNEIRLRIDELALIVWTDGVTVSVHSGDSGGAATNSCSAEDALSVFERICDEIRKASGYRRTHGGWAKWRSEALQGERRSGVQDGEGSGDTLGAEAGARQAGGCANGCGGCAAKAKGRRGL